MTTIYKALTPYGAFQATWGEDEESPVEYTGSADAIAYFRDFLALQSLSGLGGALIQFDTLEPAELYGFCQSEKHGISVLPTEDDLMDELEQDEMTTTPVLDAVGSAEEFDLIGEGVQIFTRLDNDSGTFFADLDRLRVILQELGVSASPAPDTSTPERAYLQSVIDGTVSLSDLAVADELGKIHAAHGGDAGMLPLFKSALVAYANHALAQADEALKG
jgi:hypothetical protein